MAEKRGGNFFFFLHDKLSYGNCDAVAGSDLHNHHIIAAGRWKEHLGWGVLDVWELAGSTLLSVTFNSHLLNFQNSDYCQVM